MANTTWSGTDKSAGVTLTGSNLIATATGSGNWVRAADKQVTGKFYWECKPTVWGNGNTSVGFCLAMVTTPAASAAGTCAVVRTGAINVNGVASGSTLGARAANDVIGIAVDFAARLAWFRVAPAGNWNGNVSADPATGVAGLACGAAGGVGIPGFPLAVLNASSESITANFGDTAFIGTVPSGFASGFTSGAAPPTNALATLVAVEHWATVADASPVVPSADTRAMVLA